MIQHKMCTGGHIVPEYTGYTTDNAGVGSERFQRVFKSARYDVQKSFVFL